MQGQLEGVLESREHHREEKHKLNKLTQRAVASKEEMRKSGIHLAAETDARFRKLLAANPPRPGQRHVAKLIET